MNTKTAVPVTKILSLWPALCLLAFAGAFANKPALAMPDKTPAPAETTCQDQQPPSDEEDRKRKEEWMRKQEAVMREEALKAKIKRALDNAKDGDPEKALKEIDEILEENSDIPNINYFRGLCYVKLNMPEKAEDEFNAEIKKNPNSIDARMELVKMKTAAGRVSGTKTLFEEILKIDPKHSEALQGLVSIYMQDSDYRNAEKYLTDYTRANPDNPASYLALGDIYRLYLKDEKKSAENYGLFLKKDTEKTCTSSLISLMLACLNGEKYELGLIEDEISCEKTMGNDSGGKFTETKTGKILKDDAKEYVIKTHEGRELRLAKMNWSNAQVKKGRKTSLAEALEKYFESLGRITGITDENFITLTTGFISEAAKSNSSTPPEMSELLDSFITRYVTFLVEKGTEEQKEALTKSFESQGYITLDFGHWMRKKDFDFIEAISSAKTARTSEYQKCAKKIAAMQVPQAPFAAGYYFMLCGEFESAITKFKDTAKNTDDPARKQEIEKMAATLSGLLPCKKCQGLGKILCTKCGGTGILVCKYCGGDGIIEIDDMLTGIQRKPCPKCTTPKQTCPTCNGEKLVDCPKCDEPWAEILKKNQPLFNTEWCDKCGRKGYTEDVFAEICDKCSGLGQVLLPAVKKTDDKEKK
ncbi:MAG: tetratricopeptide repeat protein [Planctomycetes bacterium]|nr:tetratricopeptide repeat protein [Planctomycetota bacterium]